MALDKIDYYNERRQDVNKLAPLPIWDRYTHHLAQMKQRDENSLLDIYASNAPSIYAGMKKQDKQALVSAILLARHQRLDRLLEMFTQSNIIDFIIIKFPAWIISDAIYNHQERKTQNV